MEALEKIKCYKSAVYEVSLIHSLSGFQYVTSIIHAVFATLKRTAKNKCGVDINSFIIKTSECDKDPRSIHNDDVNHRDDKTVYHLQLIGSELERFPYDNYTTE